MIQVTDRPAAHASELAGSLPQSRSLPGASAARAPRILVVDDEDDFREALSLNLGDEGFGVTGFADGAKALEHLVSGKEADLVLLDWRLPGMTGLEVLRAMRDRGVTTPVVFVTAIAHRDRKSTRLNSSHANISYAVFCLKKKKTVM